MINNILEELPNDILKQIILLSPTVFLNLYSTSKEMRKKLRAMEFTPEELKNFIIEDKKLEKFISSDITPKRFLELLMYCMEDKNLVQANTKFEWIFHEYIKSLKYRGKNEKDLESIVFTLLHSVGHPLLLKALELGLININADQEVKLQFNKVKFLTYCFKINSEDASNQTNHSFQRIISFMALYFITYPNHTLAIDPYWLNFDADRLMMLFECLKHIIPVGRGRVIVDLGKDTDKNRQVYIPILMSYTRGTWPFAVPLLHYLLINNYPENFIEEHFLNDQVPINNQVPIEAITIKGEPLKQTFLHVLAERKELSDEDIALLDKLWKKIPDNEKTGFINLCCENGEAALYIAAKNLNLELIKFLVENGADLNAKYSNNGTVLTAINQAMQVSVSTTDEITRKLQVIRLLAKRGADLDIKNEGGFSAREYYNAKFKKDILMHSLKKFFVAPKTAPKDLATKDAATKKAVTQEDATQTGNEETNRPTCFF